MSAFLLGIGFRADMGTCARKLVLLKLIDACEEDGTRIFPAIATIARAAQCSPRQVQRELLAFREIGLIRLVREGGKGPRSTNEYALDVDMLQRLGREGWSGVVAPRDGDGQEVKGDMVSPLEKPEKGDTADGARVTPATDKGDKLCHPTPPEPSIDPSSEREARAREPEEGEPEASARDDLPGTAAFQKRVMRFCSGRGFLVRPWPDWDTSSPDWIGRQFAALSPEERAEAERWRDAYLFDMRDRGKSPVPVGVFLKGRVWTGLEPAILERAEKRTQAGLTPDDRARPEGWAKFLGPVGMAKFFAVLLDGAASGLAIREAFVTDPQLRDQWPEAWRFRALLRQGEGVVFGPRWHALKGLMEPVPQSSARLAEWRETFAARGWLWLAEFDRLDVVSVRLEGRTGWRNSRRRCETRIGVDKKRLNEAEVINLDRCYAASDRQIALNRRQQALLAAAGEDGVIRRWAIVRVAPRRENDVDKSMLAALIEHWLPLRKAEKPLGGRRRGAEGDAAWVLAWPGYLFVHVADTPAAWAGIASIKHVVSVLGVDGVPFFLDDKIMLKIKAELATLKEVRPNAGTVFAKGDKVLVESGPFASFQAVVSEMGEGGHDGRARVEVMIFGRVVPVELDLAQLAK